MPALPPDSAIPSLTPVQGVWIHYAAPAYIVLEDSNRLYDDVPADWIAHAAVSAGLEVGFGHGKTRAIPTEALTAWAREAWHATGPLDHTAFPLAIQQSLLILYQRSWTPDAALVVATLAGQRGAMQWKPLRRWISDTPSTAERNRLGKLLTQACFFRAQAHQEFETVIAEAVAEGEALSTNTARRHWATMLRRSVAQLIRFQLPIGAHLTARIEALTTLSPPTLEPWLALRQQWIGSGLGPSRTQTQAFLAEAALSATWGLRARQSVGEVLAVLLNSPATSDLAIEWWLAQPTALRSTFRTVVMITDAQPWVLGDAGWPLLYALRASGDLSLAEMERAMVKRLAVSGIENLNAAITYGDLESLFVCDHDDWKPTPNPRLEVARAMRGALQLVPMETQRSLLLLAISLGSPAVRAGALRLLETLTTTPVSGAEQAPRDPTPDEPTPGVAKASAHTPARM